MTISDNIINKVYSDLMRKYRNLMYYKGDIYCFNKFWFQCTDIIENDIYEMALENGVSPTFKLRKKIIQLIQSQYRVDNILEDGDYISFDNVALNVKQFMIGNSLSGSVRALGPNVPSFYYIPHKLPLNHWIVRSLEKGNYTTQDLVNLAERHTPMTVFWFKQWTRDWIKLYEFLGYSLVIYGNPLKLIFIFVADNTSFWIFLRKVLGEFNIVPLDMRVPHHAYRNLVSYSTVSAKSRVDLQTLKILIGEEAAKIPLKGAGETFTFTAKHIFLISSLKELKRLSQDVLQVSQIIEFNYPEQHIREFPPEDEIEKILLLSLYFARLMISKKKA